MLNLMRKHQKNQILLLKYKVLIQIMYVNLKYFLKGVQNLTSIIIIIMQIHKQIVNVIFNKKSILIKMNKLNINNHLNLLIMIKILIKVYIMEIVCLLKKDIVQYVIKIK